MYGSVFKNKRCQFVLGLCLGLSISLFLQTHRYLAVKIALKNAATSQQQRDGQSQSIGETAVPGHFHEAAESSVIGHKFEDETIHHDDDTVARDLYSKVRVLCWVLTMPSNLNRKAIHVKKTWGKRCTKTLFMSSVSNDSFPAVGLNVSEGRDHLTAKTMQAFKYIYDHHYDEADWFMKADDDTYVILENLRYFLSEENPKKAVYFGHRFKLYTKQGYPSGGGGYVLSKEALRRYGEIGSKDPNLCARDKGPEDAQMGRCMDKLGVKLKPSSDALGRSRFHCFHVEKMIQGHFKPWYYKFDSEGARSGLDTVSDYAISFHYVSPEQMYFFEYYTYHLHTYGIIHKPQALNLH